MKRVLLILAAIASPAIASAQSTTMSFDGLSFGTISAAYPGFTFGFTGSVFNNALRGEGMDVLPLFVASSTPFTLNSLDIASATSSGNTVTVRGYTLDYINAVNAAATDVAIDGFFARLHDVPSVAFPPAMFIAAITVDPGVFQALTPNWSGLGAVVFSSTGGHVPGTPELVGGYLVDNIRVVSVTTAPEPASVLLLAVGGILLAAGRRAAPPRAARGVAPFVSQLLESSWYSVEQAKRRLAEFEGEVVRFRDSQPYAAVVETNAERTEDVHKIKLIKPLPRPLPGIAFEIVSHLRAALDRPADRAPQLRIPRPERSSAPSSRLVTRPRKC